ncbi:hypothetical protein ABB37_02369 [Leptomonas pyrrhocoris]|uniref:Tyrosine specific protein phosphatases domain-containing protein n=1 Tax=Leptomonas pyrrhocoris TaxID=157538 RepID=A0A0N0VGW5_LEPPY|nr:hypothetical protein ABB37_02369 [Leptomonas pyrrhocoris]KPA84381.1 hypothetical protein ABB37_02369 [Leptomonas pyrrhocoris]|eukprot:XP_015662820.1 hypothetical protein ABB37_02369 [Leptomonas pyrrhocoris]
MTQEIQRQRHVPLLGTTNLRNLGGYHTNDGTKTTKWGVLYRCDQLAEVPPEMAQRVLVEQLHIHEAYDLRGEKEVAAKSYDIPRITRHAIPVEPSQIDAFIKRGEDMSKGDVTFRAMQAVYRQLIVEYGAVFGSVIKSILAGGPSPEKAALIHCTGGKDRTGWVAYLILTLLDVKEEEKRSDYMLTNTYFRRPTTAFNYFGSMGADAMKSLYRVDEVFLDTALEEVDKLGGMAAYVKSYVGLTEEDIQQLRNTLLE